METYYLNSCILKWLRSLRLLKLLAKYQCFPNPHPPVIIKADCLGVICKCWNWYFNHIWMKWAGRVGGSCSSLQLLTCIHVRCSVHQTNMAIFELFYHLLNKYCFLPRSQAHVLFSKTYLHTPVLFMVTPVNFRQVRFNYLLISIVVLSKMVA